MESNTLKQKSKKYSVNNSYSADGDDRDDSIIHSDLEIDDNKPKLKGLKKKYSTDNLFYNLGDNSISAGSSSDNENGKIKSNILKRIVQKDDDRMELPIVSVVVTIHSGSSYDNLFRSVEQKAPSGRIRLYSLNLFSVGDLLKILMGEAIELDESGFIETAKLLIEDIKQVESDCVLFNYECCSACESGRIEQPANSEGVISLTKYCIDKGYMVMFSDFAVKMLLKIWKTEELGPNPFVKIEECSGMVKLEFDTLVLKLCPSKQLQMVGDLADKGFADVDTMGGTIVIGHDPSQISNAAYIFSILTYVTNYNSKSENQYHVIHNGQNAAVGHAMLKYPSGGTVIISAVHWIALQKLDVNFETLKDVAQCNYGSDYDGDLKSIDLERSMSKKRCKINRLAKKFVQQSVPCKEMKSKTENILPRDL
jgi:hypothetical protein